MEAKYLRWKRSWHEYLMEAWVQFLMETKNNYMRTHRILKRRIRIVEILMKWFMLSINRWKTFADFLV
jgi:hypothetical protein